MLAKKIVACMLTFVLLGVIAVSSVIASADTVYKYNKTYTYDGVDGEMGWAIKGTTNQAITTTTNHSAEDTRYMNSYTVCRNTDNKGVVKTSTNDTTARYGGVAATITRSPTNKKYYYYHQSYMKSSSSSTNPLYFNSKTVYQTK